MYERVDEHYRIYTELLPSGEFVIRLYCVNPIENLAQCLSQGKAAVFFLGNASAAPVLPDASVGSGRRTIRSMCRPRFRRSGVFCWRRRM